MSGDHEPCLGRLSSEQWRYMEGLCDQFEALWKSARSPEERPRIEEYCPATENWVKATILRELLKLDRAYRIENGEMPALEEYQQRFPEFAKLIADIYQDVVPSEILSGELTTAPATPPVTMASTAQYHSLRFHKRGGQGDPGDLQSAPDSPKYPSGIRTLSPEQWHYLDGVCKEFEDAWKNASSSAERPRIQDYLPDTSDPVRGPLLRELVNLELAYRSQIGEKSDLQEYLNLFPEFAESMPSDDNSDVYEGTPLPPESPSVVPDRIGRYKVCGKLGGGTFGEVYLAHDDLMDRQVAIKVPSLMLLASQGARDQFLSEARSVGRLEHEGIVRAYDFGQEADGQCYIVYEFIEGTNLAECVAAKPLPPADAARIVAQVAEALHYAHLQGLVHRDVKPANILLDRQGKPCITDFGLAVREEDLPKERGRLAGTLPYMSPEQVRREGHHIDGRTDIYSLGVVLYELVCERRPFDAKEEDELKDQILHREAKPPRQIKDSIPRELERICLRALSKRVQDRYTTAKDMAEEILHAIEPSKSDRNPDSAISLQEIERRMASADEDELRRLLRLLQQTADPACVPQVFRCLSHPSEAVRQQARQAARALGWDRVSDAAEDLARREDVAGIAAVLDGLAAFEAHPQIVALLDRLLVRVKGDLRNRTILLLERKRLGLELDAVVGLFRDIHSPYRIEKALGQGLFTAAYLAHAEETDLVVVVRVLRPELAGQPHLRAQFLDVNKKALQLVHENVVLTRESRAFPERSIYFAVRDYVDGVTLQKLLEQGKRFERAQVVRILRQLLAALGAIHRRGMCHGGVKPSNVFVCQEDRVVLGDLSLPVQGIGVALERLSYDYRYAAPESFRGSGPVGPESDFYSLGCVAYELACGEPPFVSDNYLDLAVRHLHEAVVPPSQRGSRFGPVGDEVLMKLLARSPADRNAKAEDVLGALDRLEASWRMTDAEVRPSDAPLLRDASLARLRGTESVLGFDTSAASQMQCPEENDYNLYKKTSLASGPAQTGGFKKIKRIGSGGFGEVWRAEAPGGVEVAIKIVFRPIEDDAAQRELQSLELTKRLRHPFLLQTQQFQLIDGKLHIVMELADGSLRDRLKQCRGQDKIGIPVTELIVYFREAAEALDYLHSERIFHRDVKPDNILLLKGHAKLADFGLARFHEGDMSVTASSSGTPVYMAPEVWRRKVSDRSDQYSLAISYVELRLDRAFACDVVDLMAEHLDRRPDLDPLPEAEQEVLQKALSKDPAQRFSSCGEFVKALERALAKELRPTDPEIVLSQPTRSAAPARPAGGTQMGRETLVPGQSLPPVLDTELHWQRRSRAVRWKTLLLVALVLSAILVGLLSWFFF